MFSDLSKGRVLTVGFSPDGKFVAAGTAGGEIFVWDISTQGLLTTDTERPISKLAFSPDSTLLAAESRDEISLFDVIGLRKVEPSLKVKSKFSRSLAFDQEGKTLASAGEGKIILWDVASHQRVGSLPNGISSEEVLTMPEPIENLFFSPDRETLLSVDRFGTFDVWDLASHKKLDSPVAPNFFSPQSVFSADGKLWIAGDQNSIILWDIAAGKQFGSALRGHTSTSYALAISPDTKMLASGAEDGTIILWDITRQQRIGPILKGHQRRISSMSFGPDGKTLISGSDDETVVLWNLDQEYWQKLACGIANRNLTLDEWKRYFGDEPYHKTCPKLRESQ